jgi:hypothetical protein
MHDITPDSPATMRRGLIEEQVAEIRQGTRTRPSAAATLTVLTRSASRTGSRCSATETRTGDGQVTSTPALVIVSDVEYERFTSEAARDFALDLSRAALLPRRRGGPR